MSPDSTTESLTVAVVQHPPVFLNLAQSLAKASNLIREAAVHGACVVAFPETWLPGYPVWLDFAPSAALWDHAPAKVLYRLLADNAVSVPGEHFNALLAVAAQTGTYVIMGAHEKSGGTLYNTMMYLDRDGKSFQLHRKLMPTYSERLVWGRGDGSTLGVLPTDFGHLGGLICWEHWMPLARAAMHAQEETMHVAQWPSVKELHQLASRHYAFEGQCFVLAAGSVLSRRDVLDGFRTLNGAPDEALAMLEEMPIQDEELILNGGSAVIGPDASYIAGPLFDESCIVYAEIEPGRLSEGHLVIDTDGHYSRPDVFHLKVNIQQQLNVTFGSQQNQVL